jgi:GT2 family glycosyltransferase
VARVNPVVSIVTAAYNAATYLPEAVDSVLTQTYPHFEMIIVDDGSTDDTAAVARVLAAADRRLRVVSTDNGGQASARNTAIRSAQGQFIVLLDSDDLLAPDYLACQLARFGTHADVAIVTPNAVNRGGGAAFDGKAIWPETSGLEYLTLRDLIEHEDAMCIISMFRRDMWEAIGGFNTHLRRNEDYEFWLRAAIAGYRILRSLEPIAVYRRRDDSLSSDEPEMLRGVMNVLRHIDPMLDDRPEDRTILRRQLARFRRELPRAELRRSLQHNDAATAARVLRELAVARDSSFLAACAGLTRFWPQPLLWAYHLRRGMRRA